MTTLSPFEGLPVTAVGIEIPGAAGGLRDAMEVEPQEFHRDDEVFVVLRCVCAKVRFDPAKGDDTEWRRVHVMAAEQATIVDGDLVREHLAATAERVRLAREEAEGIQRLALEEAEKEALAAEAEEDAAEGRPLRAVPDNHGGTAPVPSSGKQRVAIANLIGAMTQEQSAAYVEWAEDYSIPLQPKDMNREQADRVLAHLNAQRRAEA